MQRFLNESAMLGMLLTSCVRGLWPFWRNSYGQYGDILNENFIRSKVSAVHPFVNIFKLHTTL
jgi:hypothetical protein